ncbi:UNKNOWN [Stylonychia lemnae]|uniref:Uncharacterized protein n=1 Tax=Stylonychia lemnae TaxID=5949 RepID=A0A078AN25_STYLE|nr:UNKNOWN [Stylonychia lemnae]|eukprot:CDW83559.1 UNKNOWN [Stylonychia lemnae]
MKYRTPVGDISYENQKRGFNLFEKKLRIVLWVVISILVLIYIANAWQMSVSCNENFDTAVKYGDCLVIFMVNPVISYLFIKNAKRYRSDAWESLRSYVINFKSKVDKQLKNRLYQL